MGVLPCSCLSAQQASQPQAATLHTCLASASETPNTVPESAHSPPLQDAGAVRAAKQCAEDLGAAVRYASKHDLNMVADNRPHQVC